MTFHAFKSFDSFHQSILGLLMKKDTRLSIHNSFQRPPLAKGNDRAPRSHCLKRHNPKIFLTRKNKRLATRVVVPQYFKRLAA